MLHGEMKKWDEPKTYTTHHTTSKTLVEMWEELENEIALCKLAGFTIGTKVISKIVTNQVLMGKVVAFAETIKDGFDYKEKVTPLKIEWYPVNGKSWDYFYGVDDVDYAGE